MKIKPWKCFCIRIDAIDKLNIWNNSIVKWFPNRISQASIISFYFLFCYSILGHRIPDVPIPLFNVYPATKFALTALSQTIRQELIFQRANIKLTVCIKYEFSHLNGSLDSFIGWFWVSNRLNESINWNFCAFHFVCNFIQSQSSSWWSQFDLFTLFFFFNQRTVN